MTTTRKVVLVGAGHAHIEVLRQWALRPPRGSELTLVVDRNPSVYSGMVPGLIAGQYMPKDIEIDVIALARRAGARVVLQSARTINTKTRVIDTVDGQAISYDWASLDVGSTVAGSEIPGVVQHALSARPIERLVVGIEDLIQRAIAQSSAEPFRLLVVGAGAGGVELAFCIETRLRRDTQRPIQVTLLDAGDAPLSGAPAGLKRRLTRKLAQRGIRFRGRAIVVSLEGTSALLAEGTKIEADAVVWVPGPAPHAFLSASDLPLDDRGFIRIEPTFRVEGAVQLFAVGDCASLPGMKKAGVYAVRAGPILADNLRNALSGDALRVYEPQSEFLSLLNLGDGTALGIKRGISFEGRWVMNLKNWIDRRFMERYQ